MFVTYRVKILGFSRMFNGVHYRIKNVSMERDKHREREREGFNKIGLIFFTEQEQSELKFTEDDKKKRDNWL